MRIINCMVILLVFVSSCAKEIYTNEDATNSKRESQKVGLTVMIRDIGGYLPDMNGFSVGTFQCGELIEGVTNADGIVNLMVVRGDAALHVRKEGYVSATAVVSTNASEKERNNTVVIIPVFPKESDIEIDMLDMTGLTGGKYQPGALTYSKND